MWYTFGSLGEICCGVVFSCARVEGWGSCVGVLRRSFCRSVVLKLHPAEQHHHDRRDDG